MNRREIEKALKDYHWMVKEIERLRQLLGQAGENLCQQYGIESTLPKPQGSNTDKVFNEVARRERSWRHLERLLKKVAFIESRIHLITDDKERTVLHCTLDGMQANEIAAHMNMSERQLYNVRESIIARIAGFAGIADFAGKLQQERECV